MKLGGTQSNGKDSKSYKPSSIDQPIT